MANVRIATQQIVATGLTPAYTGSLSTSNTYQIDNGNQSTFLHVKNAGGSPTTVTVNTPGSVSGLSIADLAVVVAAGAEAMIGPFPQSTYAQAGTNDLNVTLSFITSVTLGAFTF